MTLYTNATLVDEQDISTYINGIDFSTTVNLLMGKGTASTGYFHGLIDHVGFTTTPVLLLK